MARRWKTFAFLGTEQDLFQGPFKDCKQTIMINVSSFYGFKAIF